MGKRKEELPDDGAGASGGRIFSWELLAAMTD